MNVKQQISDAPFTLRLLASALLVALLCAAWWALLRYPASVLGLGFLDDGETLYHGFALSQGLIPYRDDTTHHFLGYALPYALLGPWFGFTPTLVYLVTAAAIGLSSGLVFWGLRSMTGVWLALLGALVVSTGREPAEIGYFVQYQFNVFVAAIIALCLWGLQSHTRSLFRAAAFASGLFIVWDQRGALCVMLPLCANLLHRDPDVRHAHIQPHRVRESIWLLCLASIAPLVALTTLWWQSALTDWFVQTIQFPLTVRSGSHGLLERLWLGLFSQRYLFTMTPITAIFGVLGLFELRRSLNTPTRPIAWFLLLCMLPLLGMPILGGRDFDYYCLTWYPWIGILVPLSAMFLSRGFPRLAQPICFLPVIVPLLGGLLALRMKQTQFFDLRAHQEGQADVVEFLNKAMLPTDSIYIWGYRLELLVRLGRLSHFRQANRLFVHPDHPIADPAHRQQHEFAPFVAEFKEQWAASPPKFLVTYTRTGALPDSSEINSFVTTQIVARYQVVFETNGTDFTQHGTHYQVFRLR